MEKTIEDIIEKHGQEAMAKLNIHLGDWASKKHHDMTEAIIWSALAGAIADAVSLTQDRILANLER